MSVDRREHRQELITKLSTAFDELMNIAHKALDAGDDQLFVDDCAAIIAFSQGYMKGSLKILTEKTTDEYVMKDARHLIEKLTRLEQD